MAKRRLLISYAHPDDESFGNGGLIAKYVAEGVDVYYICATDGDVGTIPEDMQGQYQTIRELRLAELDCASQKLGFKKVFTLGYRDSGMMMNDDKDHPDALWHNYQTQPDRVIRDVVDVIREIRPQVIITFNQYGGYGHPDHIAIQRATTKAFHKAGDAEYATDGLPPYQPQKLYYSSTSQLMLKWRLLRMKLQGEDTRRMGRNKDIDFDAIVEHLEPIHARVHIADYLDAWQEAAACHQSQGGGSMIHGYPKWWRSIILAKQGFTRVFPTPARNVVDESDLFENVSIIEEEAPLREMTQ